MYDIFDSIYATKYKFNKGHLFFPGVFNSTIARYSDTYACRKGRMDGIVKGIEIVLWQRSESGFVVRAV